MPWWCISNLFLYDNKYFCNIEAEWKIIQIRRDLQRSSRSAPCSKHALSNQGSQGNVQLNLYHLSYEDSAAFSNYWPPSWEENFPHSLCSFESGGWTSGGTSNFSESPCYIYWLYFWVAALWEILFYISVTNLGLDNSLL